MAVLFIVLHTYPFKVNKKYLSCNAYIYTFDRALIHSHACTHIHTHTHIYVRTYIRILISACTRARTHIYTHYSI